MSWRVGADIGGTFIDFCAFDGATGKLSTLKVLTTPDAPGQEVMDGLALLEARHGLVPAMVSGFVQWHHDRHQHHNPAQGCQSRSARDCRL